MDHRYLIAGAMALSIAACTVGCGGSKSSTSEKATEKTTASEAKTTEASTAPVTTAEPTTEELIPPVPAEATDPNAVTFEDGDFSFAEVKTVDADCAMGTVSVVDYHGNKMLKFTDDFSVPLKGKVQKIVIHPAALIGQENLGKVRRIEFDAYADALAQNYKNAQGEMLTVPGTICGGGGTVTAKKDSEGEGKWYDFEGFEGGEYNFDYSGPIHCQFKFRLAASGLCWDDTMDDANFLIMRWGSENDSNFYVDNIVFFDENDKSIPIVKGTAPEAASSEVSSAGVPDINIDDLLAEAEQKVSELDQQAQEAIDEASRMASGNN